MRDLHVAITGASSGIGEGLAHEAARRGAKLTLVARRRELLEKIAGDFPAGTRRHLVVADLSDSAHAIDWIAEAERALGPIDILINNAGVQIVRATVGSDPEAGEALLRLNLFTPMRLCLTVAPAMVARGAGTIVNIASLAGLMPTAGMFYYNASKAGLGGASEGLRSELRGSGVHVLTVYPGPVTTPMEQAARAQLQMNTAAQRVPTGDVATLSRLVYRAVERRKKRVIYPGFYRLVRHLPNIARWVTDRFTPPAKV